MNSAASASTKRRLVVALLVFAAACSSDPSAVQTGLESTTRAPTSLAASPTTESAIVTVRGDAGAERRQPVPYRVLAENLGFGQPFTTAVFGDRTSFEAVAAEASLDPGGVDFDTEVVFVFDLAESSTPTCAITPLIDLLYDEVEQRVFPSTSLVDPKSGCEGDARPHRIIVAVSRDVLPASEFSVWIDDDEPPGCCVDGVTVIAAGELSLEPA